MVVNGKPATELETFLPHDGSEALTTKNKVQITSKDAENGLLNQKTFDPFAERNVENPTTDGDTLTHLLKASLGTGILAMPCAFRSSGLGLGIFSTIFVAFICTYCAYILVKCAHVLYHKTHKTQMSFADVAVAALELGPKPLRKYSTASRWIIDLGLFITYFGTCSVYAVIVAKNFKEVYDYHFDPDVDVRIIIALLLLPFVLLTWIPDLKYLAPVSMLANIFMGSSLIAIFCWLGHDLFFKDKDIMREGFHWAGITVTETNDSLTTLTKDEEKGLSRYSKYPQFFSLTVFAMEAIGVIMPLENKMKTPQNFVGPFGVLSRGMAGVTVVYIILGVLGYLVNPKDLSTALITLELPMNDASSIISLAAQVVRVFVGLAVFCTFCLQFFVCLDILWSFLKKHFSKNAKVANYTMRTVLVVASVLLAIAVPEISPLISLLGAFCFSILGLMVPVFIESVTYWEEDGTNRRFLRTIKNVVIGVIALLALYFGSTSAFTDIKKKYRW